MGTAANWPRVLWRRRHVAAPLEQARYEAWLEEDIESGGTPFPGGVQGFLENRELAATAEWRGPTKPRADDLKTAKAALTWKAVGVPDSVIFDELGLDVDDVYDMRKREKDRRALLGIDEPPPSAVVLGNDAAGDGGTPQDGGTGA
jgi:capsid protein